MILLFLSWWEKLLKSKPKASPELEKLAQDYWEKNAPEQWKKPQNNEKE